MSDLNIVEGFLEKKGPTRFSPWKVRFFRLVANELSYSKGENTEVLGRIIMEPMYKVVINGGSNNAWIFEVVTPGRTYQFRYAGACVRACVRVARRGLAHVYCLACLALA